MKMGIPFLRVIFLPNRPHRREALYDINVFGACHLESRLCGISGIQSDSLH
jgi:hypothetical protein